ncbi:MAG: glycosyltransferase family 4 protein, partial [Myxococcales bacterium]|nr:glycosyltransferase family 4 protein [Myxococcales bacterium]
QTYSLELARRLAHWCEALEVVAPVAPGWEALDRTLPFAVRRVRSSTDALVATGAPTLWRRAFQGRFDVAFHAQWTTAPGSLLARRLGRPRRVFVAAHGRELLLRPAAVLPPPAQHLYDALRRSVLRRADGILAVSRYTAGLARSLGVDPGRIHVVPNGVDASRFDLPDAAARAERFRRRHDLVDRPCFTTVARLMPHKGIDTGIRALPALRRQLPRATYVIVGDGPDAERLRDLARTLGVADAVRMLGRVSDDEVVDALLACDALALLSREAPPDVEGFGLVLLEAGACGRPVLGARSGGIPDAVDEGTSGLLVPPDDPAATAQALARLLGDPALARHLGEGGRQRARGALGWDRAARAIFEAMQASLSGSRPAPPRPAPDTEPPLPQ